jgi:hypothetical protein
MNYKLFLLLFTFVCSYSFAQTNPDRVIAEKFLQSTTKVPIDSAMIKAGLYFLETTYVGGTLERSEKEELIINLRETDCMILVETCLALSRTLQLPSPDWDSFKSEVQKIRYRNGIIDGYVSRLHYTTDWIFDNVKKGIFEDVTNAVGGRKFDVNVFFMSKNAEKYKHLANDPDAVQQMKRYEQAINARSNYSFIPKNEISQHLSQIKNGDIIGFTTSLAGLDISHLGIAYWHKGKLTFIHASSTAKKVVIDSNTLIGYCNSIQTCTGIVVLRPVNSDK